MVDLTAGLPATVAAHVSSASRTVFLVIVAVFFIIFLVILGIILAGFFGSS